MLEIMSLAAVKTRDEQFKLSAPGQEMSAKRSVVPGTRHQVGSGVEGWTKGWIGDAGMGGDMGAGAGSGGREDPGEAWVTPTTTTGGGSFGGRQEGAPRETKEDWEFPEGGREGCLQTNPHA